MRADGARVIEVQGTYEDAVRLAAEHGHESGASIVSDTLIVTATNAAENVALRLAPGVPGTLEVDFDDDGAGTGDRFRKDSFHWYREVIASNGAAL